MQAGRELDAKVAEALGFQGVKYGRDEVGEYAHMISEEGHSLGKVVNVPKFSTTGDGMLQLIEAARLQGIWLDHETFADGYEVNACVYRSKLSRTVLADSMFRAEDLPGEYARVYIKAKEAV
ncbi:hypothetical protein [Brevibacillus sp. MER 51]|uniref:hypothetical protein n=1 Tax=Brevibacillus sp. MER 51 TaxID=2939560 RepID=UPI00203F4E1D|nr:hypothetical protein [Brevibacillus sp. MER 51]MCM3141680.1 hypothetical protein [Brevibacillus sp. MER 51]